MSRGTETPSYETKSFSDIRDPGSSRPASARPPTLPWSSSSVLGPGSVRCGREGDPGLWTDPVGCWAADSGQLLRLQRPPTASLPWSSVAPNLGVLKGLIWGIFSVSGRLCHRSWHIPSLGLPDSLLLSDLGATHSACWPLTPVPDAAAAGMVTMTALMC